MGNPHSRQRGAVAPLLVLGLATAIFAFYWGQLALDSMARANGLREERATYANEVAEALGAWYARNADIEAGGGWAADSKTLFAAAGAQRRFGAAILASGQIERDGLRYRNFAVVLPRGAGSGMGYGAFDASGAFTARAQFDVALVDGYRIQHALKERTMADLDRVAQYFEHWAAARQQRNPGRDGGTNLYRPADGCASTREDELPCTGAGLLLRDLQETALLLGSGLATASAWSTPIFLNNEFDDNPSEPPYTMTVSARTPWNTIVSVKAVQPTY